MLVNPIETLKSVYVLKILFSGYNSLFCDVIWDLQRSLSRLMLSYNFKSAGPSLMIPDNQKQNQWFKDGLQLVEDHLARKPITHTAKNAILFLGDGMSITTVTAARRYLGRAADEPVRRRTCAQLGKVSMDRAC